MKNSFSPYKKAAFAVLSLLVISAMGMTRLHAQTYFPVGDLYYQINADSASVTLVGHVNGYDASGTLSLPETIIYNGKDYPVTKIGKNAFISCGGLTGPLFIPNTVTVIADNAFLACTGLTELHFGSALDTIGAAAFYGCKNLVGPLTIPNSVRYIAMGAFYGCTGFTGALTFGDGLKRIEKGAFIKCTGFTTLNLSNALTSIGSCAFWGCTGFTGSLTIPNSVTHIEANAFRNCSGFSGMLTLGRALDSIGGEAFRGCSGFTEVVSLATTPPGFSFEDVFEGFSCTTLTVPCGCIAAYENSEWHDYFTTILDDCSTVQELDGKEAFVYPNPTHGTVTIEAEDVEGISIYNMLGEKLFDTSASDNRLEYDFGRHGIGVYLVRVQTKNGIVTKQVLVED